MRAVHKAIIIALSDSAAVECKPVRFDNGVPVYRFRKQVIRCGNFTTANGDPFEVTPATLRMWLSDFHRMRANDVPVPVPTRHDDTSADGNRGFVVDMALSNDGKGLDATMELFGDEAPKLAASNHCSIYAEPGWKDGENNAYDWPIRHVALTPDPRITGLKKFISIAASNIPIARIKEMAKRKVKLDASGDSVNLPGTGYGESPANGAEDGGSVEGDPLDMILDAIEQESLPKIRSAADKSERVKLAKEMAKKIDGALKLFEEEIEEGDDEEADEDDGDQKGVDESAEKEGEKPEKDEEKDEEEKPDAHLSNDDGKWCAIEKNIEKRNRRKAAMSSVSIHPEMVRLSNQNRTMQIENLWRERKITAHQRKELMAKFAGEGPVKLALSNDVAYKSFDETIKILAGNQPIRGEMSGVQVLDDPLKLANQKDPETDSALKFMRGRLGIKD